jgi:hypothetical protein
MMRSVSQLILDFEPSVGLRDGKVLLRTYRNEREYFDAKKRGPTPEFEIQLPSLFQETALMAPGGWRKRFPLAVPTQNLGFRMWLNLPDVVRAEISSANPSEPQRISILSTATGIDDIPWEWLNAGGDGQLIAGMDSVRFVRLVPVLYAPPPLTIAPPIRVLLVLTNPKDERLLQKDIEVRTVSQSLSDNPAYEVRELLEPRLDAFKTALEWSPHIVHYIGHAGISGADGNIILHDEQDGTRWLSAAEVSRMLPSSVRLLCLSTCVTAENYQIGGLMKFAHAPSELPLPTAIVNQYALKEPEAAGFWRVFYPALFNNDGNLVEAFHEARMAAHIENPGWGWASFSIIVRDGTGHPLSFAKPTEQNERRFAAEIQAHWAARFTNNIAIRMRSLNADGQGHWEKTLADESALVESLERDIENI